MNKVKKKKEKKWSTLQHNGILFPPVYEAKGLSISINGKKTALTPLQEEMAYLLFQEKRRNSFAIVFARTLQRSSFVIISRASFSESFDLQVLICIC